MLEKALEVLKILENNGFYAYIVGGYVRDYLLHKESNDIDICTSATPKDITNLFKDSKVSNIQYGSVLINYRNVYFDITTFRKDIKYENNRTPVKIKYVQDLKTDLLRRDFTINTICFNSEKELIDLFEASKDLMAKNIKTVGNPKYKLKEDALRILRAIRFATILDFQIEEKTKHYLKKYGPLLKKLSYNRKKEELDKIFSSPNKELGIGLLISLNLDKYLEIESIRKLVPCDHIIGLWAQLNVDDLYPFSKLEKSQMVKIRELLNKDILDPYNIYQYGLYLSMIVADIKQIDKKQLNQKRNDLIITNSSEVAIKQIDIANLLNKKPGPYLKEIIKDLEQQIIYHYINNEYDDLKTYILTKYC